jgi:hypothetical protein
MEIRVSASPSWRPPAEARPFEILARFQIPGFRATGSPGFTNSVRIGTTLQFSNTFTVPA